MVSQVNNIATTGNPNTQRVPKKSLDMQDFIQLFITQLRYQDPMNPIENNEMAIQLALFNQVDQLFKINKTLDTLVNMAKSLDLAYISNLVGKKVKVETNIGRVEKGEFLGGEFNLDEPVNYLEIVIKDSKGNLIDKIQLNGLRAGNYKIQWDATDLKGNKVPDDNYIFSIIVPYENTSKIITPTMIAKITGAKLGDNTQIVINENYTLDLKDIKELIGE
uniref:Basal-body rod modification protein FlgD n=1 Tax=Thermodesulfobacterium geofontis TaxID=1295609 RepID=A0A7V6CDT9_9BACT